MRSETLAAWQTGMEKTFRTIKRIFSGNRPAWMLSYSFLCGLILTLIIAGIDTVASTSLFSSGNAAATSGNFRYFFLSWHGSVIVLCTGLLLILLAAAFLNGAVLLCEDLRRGRRIRLLKVIGRGFLSIRLFLYRKGIPLILLFAAFVPMGALTLFFLIPDPFEIPGLIRYLVHKKQIYEILYVLVLLVLVVLQVKNLFLFMEMVLHREEVARAAAVARRVGRVHRRRAALCFVMSAGAAVLLVLLCGGIFLYVPHLLQKLTAFFPRRPVRYLVLSGTYSALLLFFLSILCAPWLFLVPVTELYDRLRDETCAGAETPDAAGPAGGAETCAAAETPDAVSPAGVSETCGAEEAMEVYGGASSPASPKKLAAAAAVLCLLAVTVLSVISMRNFETWFPRARRIEAVVHRLGGDLDVENTLEGQEAALEAGAVAAETDIQRTADGEYIIFHDVTFRRLCGIPEQPCNLTLEQIRGMELLNAEGEPRHIPTLREVLEKAKGRERLYLELKGVTVDEQMADDVIAMVREMGMEEDCVLISMNYTVIRYIHRTYPEVRCGYLSFFTYGSNAKLDGNILLSLSNAISPAKTSAIHRAGKRLYAWTVNSRSQAQKMIRLNVDGIISDRYDIIQSVLDHLESRTDCERIMDVLRS